MVERLLLEEPTPSLHELGNFLASCSKVRIGSQTVKAWVWRALEVRVHCALSTPHKDR